MDPHDRTPGSVPADPEQPAVSRRTVLGGVAALPIGAVAGRSAPDRTPTVLTWNAYLGVDLFRLFRARSVEDVRRIAGELLGEIERHPYEARAEAIAAGIDAADADVVALQEAAVVQTRRRSGDSDGGTETATEPAWTEVVDLLDLIVAALAARGRSYEVAASTVTTDVEMPTDRGDGDVEVRLTDRDALLVRDGVEATNAHGERYEASKRVSLPDGDRGLELRRGYCYADVTAEGVSLGVASTHLESVSAETRRRQAEELLDRLPADRPVAVGGDFNSGPGERTEAYDALAAGFEDAYAARHPDADGVTCCQASGLRNDRSHLDSRVDAVLYRGDLRPVAVERVGEEPADRATARVDGETVTVWPSDHAGVAATFAPPSVTPSPTASATPTETETPAETATPTETATETAEASPGDETATRTESGAGPGFGAVAAVVGLAGGALARLRSE